MSEQPLPGPLDRVAQKWRRLAERRRAHFVELFESGRWKHYYSEEEFLYRLREAIQVCERWAMIAPPPVQKAEVVIDEPRALVDEPAIAAAETATTVSDEPVADIPRRSAA